MMRDGAMEDAPLDAMLRFIVHHGLDRAMHYRSQFCIA